MNKLSDEILKKKYDEIYNNFIKGDFLNVIKECNKVLKKENINYFLTYCVSPTKKLEKLKDQLIS